MTAGIRVTPEQLDSLGARVAAGSGQIESELRSLAGSIAPLGTDWAGVAQTRFLTLWQEWQRAAEQLHTALTGISQLLGQAGNAYAPRPRPRSRGRSPRGDCRCMVIAAWRPPALPERPRDRVSPNA
jgi:WXG100 family type VII secretion target